MLNSRALDFCLVLQVTEFQPVVLIADEIMLAVLRNVVQDDYPLGGNTKINSPTCTCSILVVVNPSQGTVKINPLHFSRSSREVVPCCQWSDLLRPWSGQWQPKI